MILSDLEITLLKILSNLQTIPEGSLTLTDKGIAVYLRVSESEVKEGFDSLASKGYITQPN